MVYARDGDKYIAGSSTTYGDSFTTSDVIGMAIDADNGAVYFSKNGVWQNSGDPESGASRTGAAYTYTGGTVELTPAFVVFDTDMGWVANFGQDSSFAGNKTAQGNQDANDIGDFYYAPPTGFLALCTDNLADPLISGVDAPKNFNTVLYTGNASTNAITGVGLAPDFVWAKDRASNYHGLWDVVRGTNKVLYSNTDTAETESATTGLASFDSDGFTLGANSTWNDTSHSCVAWSWKAGTANSGDTSGSGTVKTYESSTSATSGFSIIKYVGNGTSGIEIPHHLGVAPEFLIVKRLDAVVDWHAWQIGMGADKYIWLNESNPMYGSVNYFKAVSSTTFTLGSDSSINTDDADFVCYAFAGIDGYSKLGSYEGNANADGSFVYTGFRPAFLIIKNIDATANWHMYDDKRPDYNVVDEALFPNLNDAEDSEIDLDIVSNGFKLRRNSSAFNNAVTYAVLRCSQVAI